mmetsp:Transcript_44782/g.66448  ORF Transcript_44782/g.66448 Transcript_44782/m.66448 type:complete len:101 (-) Transcript_44782:22-324(-)
MLSMGRELQPTSLLQPPPRSKRDSLLLYTCRKSFEHASTPRIATDQPHVCGGTREGNCMRLKNGEVAIPADRGEFLREKKKAKKARNAEKQRNKRQKTED